MGVLLAAATPSPPPPVDCGSSEELPAFALEDLNPNSATFGTTVSLSELLDEHLVIYWSQAT